MKDIQYLIIHYTGMQSARVSMKRLKNPSSKVSCHYLIDRNGDIYRMIDDLRWLGMQEDPSGKILKI